MSWLNKTIKFLSIATVGSTLAIVNPNWERPIMESISENNFSATQEFENASNIKIVLNKRDGEKSPTSISLQFLNTVSFNDQILTQKLNLPNIPITQIKKDECGTVI